MPNDWLTYVGATTGITGAILGYKGYRRSSVHKALDLRLQLRKEVQELTIEREHLLKIIPSAQQSRISALNDLGMGMSSSTQQFIDTAQVDMITVTSIEERLLQLEKLNNPESHKELEDKLVSAHQLKTQINQLKDKYQAVFSEDEKIRENARRSRENLLRQ